MMSTQIYCHGAVGKAGGWSLYVSILSNRLLFVDKQQLCEASLCFASILKRPVHCTQDQVLS